MYFTGILSLFFCSSISLVNKIKYFKENNSINKNSTKN